MTPAEREREFRDDPFARPYRAVLFFGLLIACAFVRLYALGRKTMMHDELLFLNSAFYNLYETFNYYYQPILHGPMHLHLGNLVFHIFGLSDFTARLSSAILGICGIFWIWQLRHWLREAGTWFALAFYTLSPGIAFYQRFYREDALFLFCSLWIVASFANWWRTGRGRWAASAIIGCTVLFCNKESSLFIYFSLFTFALFLAIHDVASYFFEGKDEAMHDHLSPAPRFPNPVWPTLLLGGFVVLCITQIFEGIQYDGDVRQAIGHDFVLKDIRSIPLALGWTTLAPGSAPDATPEMATATFWRQFYLALFGGLLAAFWAIKVAVEHRVGRREVLRRLWQLAHGSRWYILGAGGASVAIYLATFTTFFQHDIGFFEIYSRTWSYWGGQHEWGRIGGPFTQHLFNILLYEFPSAFLVAAAWLYGLFRLRFTGATGVVFLLMILPVAAFQKLLFSGMQWMPQGANAPIDMGLGYFKAIFMAGAAFGIATLLVPRAGRALLPIAFFGLIAWSAVFFAGSHWAAVAEAPAYANGEPVMMMNRQVILRDYIEIQTNFDGGGSIAFVLVMVFFATIYTWQAISRGDRFRAFLVWWFVTSYGAATYAREAVPQIGIHAMLPLILLAGSYVSKLVDILPRRALLAGFAPLLGVFILWNAKACFILNFQNPDDSRERMAYSPLSNDVVSQMRFVRWYWEIAPIRMGANNRPEFLNDYNDRRKFKDVKVYLKPLSQLGWPAKWYFRDIEYHDSGDIQKAVDEGWHFLFLDVGDEDKFKGLADKYHIARGRGTTFWSPSPISIKNLSDIWKNLIPGHYLDFGPEAGEVFNSKQEWRRLWRYLILRETFDGTDRPFPSHSSFDYIFCYRKDLF